MARIMGVLLAAGRSRRYGADKLLQELPDGTPVGVAACRALLSGVGAVIAVIGPECAPLAALLRAAGAHVSVCRAAAAGMGASLACGVRSSPEVDGWVVALADMPWIKAATTRAVASALAERAGCVAPFYRGRRGHPVGFARRFGAELCRLSGDEGARSILARESDHVHRLDVEDPGILLDIDEPGDLVAHAAATGG